MHLARLETSVLLNAVLDRLPNLRLDPAAEDPHIHGLIFRSPRICRSDSTPPDPDAGPACERPAQHRSFFAAVPWSYQPSSLSRSSSMPKWWAISWMTVRRTWSATSWSVWQIAQISWR